MLTIVTVFIACMLALMLFAEFSDEFKAALL